jgi:hypothetical protein
MQELRRAYALGTYQTSKLIVRAEVGFTRYHLHLAAMLLTGLD